MRKQYYFRPSKHGFYAWDVDRLVGLSKALPIIDVKLSDIKEVDEQLQRKWKVSHISGHCPTYEVS